MDAGRSGVGRSRFSINEPGSSLDPAGGGVDDELRFDGRDDLRKSIVRNRDTCWPSSVPTATSSPELEGDSILESEYLLLLTWLGREKTDLDGGWRMNCSIGRNAWRLGPVSERTD